MIANPRSANTQLNGLAIHLTGPDAIFQVHYWGIMPHHYDNPVHRHSFYEICYVVDGEGTYLEDGQLYALKPGVLFLSMPDIWHQIRSTTGLYLIFVAFELDKHSPDSARLAYSRLNKPIRTVLGNAQGEPAILIWQALIAQAQQKNGSLDDATRSLAYALLCSFPDAFASEEAGSHSLSIPGQPQRMTQSRLLHQAKRYIRDNLSQPLHQEDVAAALYISKRHLSRLFADEGQMSYVQFVRSERVHLAGHLLHTTTWSIREIAERTGFGTIHYFSRVFTAHTGYAPAQFRKTGQPISDEHSEK